MLPNLHPWQTQTAAASLGGKFASIVCSNANPSTELCLPPDGMAAGSTACVCCVTRGQIITANAGDRQLGPRARDCIVTK